MNKFRDLKISTITINVESNIVFNLSEISQIFFDRSHLFTLLAQKTELSPSEHKKLSFPDGTISYIYYEGNWRGLRKRKKTHNKKRNIFKNQTTIDIFVTHRINVMIFRNGKIKLAGCKHTNDAIEVFLKLWSIISEERDCIEMVYNPNVPHNQHPSFIFTNEMINTSFSFPRPINKLMINRIFNKKSNCISYYEPTSQQYVKIKMLSNNIPEKNCILLEKTDCDTFSLKVIPVNLSNKSSKTCFMVFDKRVIMSGVNYIEMERHYEQFIDVFEKNINQLVLPIVN